MANEVRASHILVKTEDEAKNILNQIKTGSDFAELAKAYSDCPSSRKGGDLGYFCKGQMVKEFENTAFTLQRGQVSDPVRTQFGYHIIMVTDTR
jgi:peptidyl-prolyl cis-trans isomerase C